MTKQTPKRFTNIAIFSIFLANTVAFSFPGAALAADTTEAARYSVGNSYDECYNNLRGRDLNNIKTKKKSSIDKRKEVLRLIINERLPKIKKNKENFDAGAVKATNELVPKWNSIREIGLVGEAANPAYAQPTVPGSHVNYAAVEAAVGAAWDKVIAAENSINSSSSRPEVVANICSAVHNGKVYSYLIPLSRQSYLLSRADIVNLNNYINLSRTSIALDVYDAKKKVDATGSFDQGNALAADLNNANNTSKELQASINNILNKITTDSSSYREYEKQKATHKEITKERDAVKAQISDSKSAVRKAYSTILGKSIKRIASPSPDIYVEGLDDITPSTDVDEGLPASNEASAAGCHSRRCIIRLVKNQLGVTENPKGSNHVDRGYNIDAAWCASFATYMWKKAGISIPVYINGDQIVEWGKSKNKWHTASSGYKMHTGDIIIFDGPTSKYPRSQHTAIVAHVKDGKIEIIGGNVSDSVKYQSSKNGKKRDYPSNFSANGYGIWGYVEAPY